MLFLTMAWRNVWRNRRRSALTVSVIALSLTFNILMRGIGDGFHEQMVDNSVRANIGHLQVHRQGYHDDPGLNRTLPDPARVERGDPRAARPARLLAPRARRRPGEHRRELRGHRRSSASIRPRNGR